MRQRMIRMVILAAAVCMPLCGEASTKEFFKKVKHYLDSSAVKGADPAYIALPRKKWAVSYNTNVDQMRLTLSSGVHTTVGTVDVDFDMYMKIRQKVTTSMGLWAGYRGFGFGYSLSLTGNEGTNIGVSIASRAFGLNARFCRFKHDTPAFGVKDVRVNGLPHESADSEHDYLLSSPMSITSLVIDGYYIFNRKRFSYSAAYNQSTVQLRSAGSPIVGLMFYYQKYDPNLDLTVPLISNPDVSESFLLVRNITTFKVYQGSIGAGYTYNWVPARGWVINITAMPVLTLLNRFTAHRYDTTSEGKIQDGTYNITLADRGEQSYGGRVRLNVDVKAAVCYWLKDWFFTASAQAHYFRGSYEPVTTKYFDWTAKASIGFTF